MSNQSIVYEQPVNELVRVCLRVEHLLSMIQQGLRGQHLYDTRSALSSLMDLLSLTDRPDLRGKFTKEFVRQQANLQRFVNQDHIDQTKLKHTLSEQNEIVQLLQSHNGKFASNLRENEFLMSIRQHSSMAGGALSFDTPAFFYWLQKPLQERHAEIIKWLNEFEDLFHVIAFMLRLVRNSGQPVLHTAHDGFFQTSLDSQMPCQLIRVSVPNTLHIFPEVSVGRHGVSIRFYCPTVKERAALYGKDVPFRLSCCIV
jgi:cell division protein ZapD